MLVVERLTKSFGGNVALKDVSFALGAGELTAVIGPNGAGKTTLLDAVSGLVSLDGGSVTVDRVEISRYSPVMTARNYLERTFQKVKLADSLSARENVMLHVRGQVGARLFAAVALRRGWRDAERQVFDAAGKVLAQLHLEQLAPRAAGLLSFGQRKVVSLCGALAAQATVVLLDEPFTGLDPEKTQVVADCLRHLAEEGRYVLFVEHNLTMVANMAVRVLALDRGALVADGPPEAVLGSDRLTEAYLR